VTGKRWWAHANKDPGNEQPASLLWIETQRNDQRLSFVAHVIDNSSGVGTDITVGDINADGLSDILSGTKRGAHIFLQRPSAMDPDTPLVPGLATKDRFQQRPATDFLPLGDGFIPAIDGRPLHWNFSAGDLLDWEIRGSIVNGQRLEGWIDT